MSSLDDIRVFQFTHNLHHVPILAWWYLRIWWRFGLGETSVLEKSPWTGQKMIILGWTEGFNRWGVKNSRGNLTPTSCLLAGSSLKELWGAAQERPAMRAGRKYFTNNPGYVMIMTYNNNTTRVTWQKYHYPMNNLASSDQIMLKRTLNQVVWKKFDCVNNGFACLKSPILVSLLKRLFTSRRLLDVRGFNMDITIKKRRN